MTTNMDTASTRDVSSWEDVQRLLQERETGLQTFLDVCLTTPDQVQIAQEEILRIQRDLGQVTHVIRYGQPLTRPPTNESGTTMPSDDSLRFQSVNSYMANDRLRRSLQ